MAKKIRASKYDPTEDDEDSIPGASGKASDRSAFFLRGLSASVAGDIAKLANDRGTSSNRLIVHIIENVFSRTELLALTLQDDGSVGSLQRFGDAFEALNWANRAFEKGFLSSAIAAYSKLVADPVERQLQGMTQLARYLGGSTLIDISNQLEFRAIQERRMPIFSDAERAVTLAIALYEEYLSVELSNVIMYNMACAYSLLARIAIHSQLAASRKDVFACFEGVKFDKANQIYRELWGATEQAPPNDGKRKGTRAAATEKPTIAELWRELMPAEKVERVERLGHRSLESLDALLETRSSRNIIGPNVTDQGFWVEYASEDAHLLLLHTDPAMSELFSRWQATFYARKEAIAPPLQALIEAEESLPRRIASRANKIASEWLS